MSHFGEQCHVIPAAWQGVVVLDGIWWCPSTSPAAAWQPASVTICIVAGMLLSSWHRCHADNMLVMSVQGKRIDNTSVRDEPYSFVLGRGQVKAAGDCGVTWSTHCCRKCCGAFSAQFCVWGVHVACRSCFRCRPCTSLVWLVGCCLSYIARLLLWVPFAAPVTYRLFTDSTVVHQQAIKAFEEAVSSMKVGGRSSQQHLRGLHWCTIQAILEAVQGIVTGPIV